MFMMMHWVFFYQAIQVSSVAIGVISILILPLITSLIEPFWIKKSFNLNLIFESVIILVGLYILLNFNISSNANLQEIIWGLLSTLSFSLRNLISRPLLTTMSSIWAMTCNIIVSTLILAPMSISVISKTSSSNLILIILSGFLISGIAQSLFLHSFKKVPVSIASIFAAMEVPYAILASWIFLDERITLSIFCGGSLILSVVLWKKFHVLYTQYLFTKTSI